MTFTGYSITKAISASNLTDEAKFILFAYLKQHFPFHTNIREWLMSEGIDVRKYPDKEYADYCLRWVKHLIFIIEKERSCLRREALSRLN